MPPRQAAVTEDVIRIIADLGVPVGETVQLHQLRSEWARTGRQEAELFDSLTQLRDQRLLRIGERDGDFAVTLLQPVPDAPPVTPRAWQRG